MAPVATQARLAKVMTVLEKGRVFMRLPYE
jgi:hypothetical protein